MGKTRYFRVAPSTKVIPRPSTLSIIANASADDRDGICEINRSPSSFDISGIADAQDDTDLLPFKTFRVWAIASSGDSRGILESDSRTAARFG